MTEVTAHSPALSAYARAQHVAADELRTQAAHQRGEVGELTPTFGVIGADFLAATAFVLDGRSRRLDTVAARHADQARATRAADDRYTESDDSAAAALRSSAPDRELSL
ncbi:type VII secretion target [Gordonia sp. ABSL11-1]|uniref:type VII secretion target n=1 Tax=Gordonia sp. ABSL11-1 TaxID=3053924 RepID=UPI00257261DC|nr:type VII secretion target [Gordonia sp. ABSL11-1]MDL9945928.1 type VII secretion target [Gordonia sp. ABSL11-1]